MRKLLLLSTLLLLPAHAQAAPNPPVKTSFGALPVTPGDDDAALALRAPAFAGLWVEGGGVALAVTSTDPAARRQVLAEVKKQRGASLNQTGHTLTAPRFVPVKYNAAQLSQARFLARGLRGWSEIYVDVKANKLHIAFQHAAYRQQAAEFFRQKGIPADALDLVAAASPTLPPRSTLSQPHRAALNVPAQVAQGDILPLSFKLTNTGRKPISLAQGCFTFKYRVLNATTGTEVRPVPAPGAVRKWALHRSSLRRVRPGNWLLRAAGRSSGTCSTRAVRWWPPASTSCKPPTGRAKTRCGRRT